MDRNNKPAVLAISSHVTRGTVGNRASVYVLEAFEFPVWAIQTVQLPWHPGQGPGTRIIPEKADFSALIDDLLQSPKIAEIGAILTGYMGNESQVEDTARLVSALRSKNPELIYLCDPVLGDNGQLYIETKTAEAVRNRLVPKADILTPNCFELGWLINKPTAGTLYQTVEQASEIGTPKLLVTSVPSASESMTGSIYFDGTDCWHTVHNKVDSVPNGLGDLTASTFLARHLDGEDAFTNISKTTASVLEVLRQTKAQCADELTLERSIANLLQPKIAVETSKVSISP